jgi:hypothetical protein
MLFYVVLSTLHKEILFQNEFDYGLFLFNRRHYKAKRFYVFGALTINKQLKFKAILIKTKKFHNQILIFTDLFVFTPYF